MISVQRATHPLQMATDGVGPQTMISTSAYTLPQKEQRRASGWIGAPAGSASRPRSESSRAMREMLPAHDLPTVR